MDMKLLKSRVSSPVVFSHFTNGVLWYKTTSDDWVFPVPIKDTTNEQGSSPTFHATEKGIMFMRWIKNYMKVQDE